jgi:hypothetical protein
MCDQLNPEFRKRMFREMTQEIRKCFRVRRRRHDRYDDFMQLLPTTRDDIVFFGGKVLSRIRRPPRESTPCPRGQC